MRGSNLWWLAAVGWLTLAVGWSAPLAASERNLILTEGSAEVMGQNDSAAISLSVLTEGRELEAVSADNSARTEAVLKSLKALKIENLKIQTANFRVEPQSDYKARPPRITGYRVYNAIEVTLEAMAPDLLSRDVSRLIGVALQNGANNLQRLDFYIKNKAPLEKEALTLATREALERAEVLAKAAGVGLKRIASISTQPMVPVPVRPVMRASMESAAPAPPVESGESVVRVQVQIAYEIE